MNKISWKSLSIKSWVLIIALGLSTLFLLVKAVDPFIAERHYREAYHLNFKAKALVNAKDFIKASSYFEFALDEYNNAIHHAPWETQYRVQKGRLLEEYMRIVKNPEKKWALILETEKLYETIIDMDPRNPWYRNRLAVINLLKQKETEDPIYEKKAENLIRTASELDPQNPLFQINYGSFLHRSGRYDEAISYYERVIDIDYEIGEAYYNLADIAKKRGNLELALRYYQQLYEINPDFAQLRLAYSSALIEAKKMIEARELLQELVEVDRTVPPEAIKSLGSLYFQTNDVENTVKTYDLLFKRHGYDPEIFHFYIQSLLKLNELAKTLQQLDSFLNVYPTHNFAVNQKKKLLQFIEDQSSVE